ncbi:TPA: hypothetical protein DDZ86_02520 [Candidatus Dependentiae bacterium]|nr:MAG: hypothetical protein UW09_C0001G0144 [candidate division TM6 bacterium GW2011_GWF2_43_87]HBL98493.1 hypothetical protein [Candidatus Dependentiae bacterium]
MKKCVKITLSDVRDANALYDLLKADTSMNDIEGVIETIMPDIVEITVYGSKDAVDRFVNEVDGAILTFNLNTAQRIKFMVEPFLKNEDYRGIMRFLRKTSPHRA